MNCCCETICLGKDVKCRTEKTEKGFKIIIESDDSKKAEALLKLYEAKQELCDCGDGCC